ncbi:2Fe-2S iron-sulfur cluster-binding protein [Sphingopyxis sp.]|uniref:2Fe-2S iron-sulfur cluster-binding protein n=1 Tax=Sphingopyxis sp. TaxID=1908224 RepID=UPI003BAA589D
MPQIIFIQPDGERLSVEADSGITAMEAARANGVAGIDADCSGACACATCHVHVAEEWSAAVGGPNDEERDILEFADEVGATSRLSCQIVLDDAMDGLVLVVPAIA